MVSADMSLTVIYGLLIPLAGTMLGSACVFFMRRQLRDGIQRALTGFASGVMTAASIWSLLIPAMDQVSGWGVWAFFPAAAGFWLGILFLLLLDHLIPHLHQRSNQTEGLKSHLGHRTMLTLAVTLHNIPEGMAVGVVYAGYLMEKLWHRKDEDYTPLYKAVCRLKEKLEAVSSLTIENKRKAYCLKLQDEEEKI